jgi:ABC-type glutathione transport system ATPase component
MVAAVPCRCDPVAPPSFLPVEGRAPDTQGMEPLAAVSFATTGGSRAAGWQQQVRVDYVVNKVMQTHRGQSTQQVAQAIRDQLRAVGVVPNKRQIAQYASAISALPELPPN